MGRHSLSYIAAQQELSQGTAPSRHASAYVGRVGLLAVALGIGAAVAGGTAVAGADTDTSNAGDGATSQTSTGPATSEEKASSDDTTPSAESADAEVDETDVDDAEVDEAGVAEAVDDPSSPPAASLAGVRRTSAVKDRDAAKVVDVSVRATTTEDVEANGGGDEILAAAADVPAVPSPTDQAPTQYGDIGKWMLQPNGEIADYGELPYEGRIVLEPVNVIIVDPTSRSSLEATWRLNAAMRRAGFPPRLGHTTGFRGLIDDQRYRQQPRGLLVGYADDSFLVTNNHGRIFGPDPVETATGYVWSGAFSTEEFVFYNGLPRHGYVSANQARDELAAQLVASGRATLGGTVLLSNAYNTDTTTTGDHDGYAVVVVLNGRTAVLRQTSDARACVSPASAPATPSLALCGAIGGTPVGSLSRS